MSLVSSDKAIIDCCSDNMNEVNSYSSCTEENEIDLADYTPHGLLLLSSEFEFIKGNAAFFDMTDLRRAEVHGREWLNCLPHMDSQAVAKALADTDWSLKSDVEIECQMLSALSHHKWVKIYARAISGGVRTAGAYVLTIVDIDQSKRLADHNQQLALVDSLTGLPNRRDFEDALARSVESPDSARSIMAVLFVDLDGFKQVNDNLGHDAGDELLKTIGKTLLKHSARAAKIARLGGDEFTILLTDIKRIEEVKHYASSILLLLQQAIKVDKNKASVSASIGIAIHHKIIDDRRGVDRIVTDLLRHADHAMYAAKQAGKNCYRFYGDQGLAGKEEGSLRNKDNLIRSLHRALNSNELYVIYQPILKTSTGDITGCEALLRWKHFSQGLVNPTRFIPIIESSGSMNDLTMWIIRTICADMLDSLVACSNARKKDSSTFTVSVNLSATQLQNRKTLESIDRIIVSRGISTAQFKFEITERTLISDPRLAEDGLGFLRQRGYRISLDDFGTGYSSLSYLYRFPIDEIKLDGGFIREVESNQASQTVVRGVVELAHALGLEVVAEGVETEPQLDFLTGIKCDFWQGYLRSAGVAPQELSHIVGAACDSLPDSTNAGRAAHNRVAKKGLTVVG